MRTNPFGHLGAREISDRAAISDPWALVCSLRKSHLVLLGLRRREFVTINPITIRDVAALVGVHPATVSRTISRPERVAPETRKLVETAIKELGYVPNRAARGLITGRTGNIAVIVPDITNPYFSTMVRAAEEAARTSDQQVILVDTGERPDIEESAARILARQVDGFVVASPRRLHRSLDALAGKPTVFVNRPVAGHPSVLLRTAEAVMESLEHLVGLGHAHVGFLGGPSRSWAAGERLKAVRRAAKVLNIQVTELGSGEPTFGAGRDATASILDSSVTAVVAFNDQMALGILSGLLDLGEDVPGRVGVVGCDDVPMAGMVSPALTTIHVPTTEAGRVAVELLQRADGNDAESIDLHAHLVVRASASRRT